MFEKQKFYSELQLHMRGTLWSWKTRIFMRLIHLLNNGTQCDQRKARSCNSCQCQHIQRGCWTPRNRSIIENCSLRTAVSLTLTNAAPGYCQTIQQFVYHEKEIKPFVRFLQYFIHSTQTRSSDLSVSPPQIAVVPWTKGSEGNSRKICSHMWLEIKGS